MPAKQTLQKRLFVLTAALGVSVVAMMSLIFFASEVAHQREHVADDTVFFAGLLGAGQGLERDNLGNTQNMTSLFDSTPAVHLACVYDNYGTLVAAHEKSGFGYCPPAPIPAEATSKLLLTNTIPAGGLDAGNARILGSLQIHSDKWAIDATEFDPITPMLVIVAALVAIVLLIGRYLSHSFLGPIIRLSENARDFDPTAPNFETVETTLAEVAELSESFQRVVETLNTARHSAEGEVQQRQAAEEAERESRKLLRHIVDLVPYLIFAVQRDGEIIFANQAVADLYGESLAELISPTFRNNYRGPKPDGLLFGSFTNEGGPDEVWFSNPDGGARRFLVRWVRYIGDHSALVIGADVTEEHRLQLQLQFSQRLEVIGTLAGGIAHDFNNLLTPILGYTSMLLESELPADVLSKLRAVETAAERARDVVHQILTFARQQTPTTIEPIDISAVVEDAADLLRMSIPSTVQFRVSAEPVGLVRADPNQLHQVVLNLCTNAAQAITGPGGVIDIRTYQIAPDSPLIPAHLQATDYACIEIQDNGRGMSPEVISHIFEPFFTTKGVGEGSGLGLSVVHGIATGHGGDITVESHEGTGSTFRTLLPLANEAGGEAPTQMGEVVMLVDDEDSVLRVTAELLTNQGYQVVTFNNPHRAFEQLRRNPEQFDVLITDHNMPDMTGAELASAVRRLRPDIPIILITGFASAAASDLDAIDHRLMKPISGREISMVIQKSLATRRSAA